ncbi:cytochrome C biogenesis protein CcmA [Erythrobacter sp. SG61-1L]|uniref:heme ABC exporter ATP-binding protein CcmA n=1 Tax=Erythrobacter sp. SG61-1L TaxID=1603897 RepID=UPI0006C931CE|nr:heme ABC exporter ATP-binding protein CcmA [Erythrobacter sp. SG61-1L]KPL69674.1 cytochrome C biogenesis protein CcmA [Erythrobacter sp. SG61-1L]
MQAARLSASNIACRRGDRLLFSGLGFSLGPGEALQVAGANGIGKSSLLRILAGLARPYVGAVEREGTVGLVDERLALDEHLPLGKALAFWSALDGEDEAQRAAGLGLSELLDVPVRYLSTGQRKRAALARLLGQKASIWLLDEPLNGLDTTAVALVTRLTAEHCASGGIAVVASHQTFALAGMQQLPLRDFVA